MVSKEPEMIAQVFPILEISNDEKLTYKRSVRQENGYFLLEKEPEFSTISKLVSCLRGMVHDTEETPTKDCPFCNIVYDFEKNVFLIRGKSEPCPTKKAVQRELADEGMYLLNNIGGWHTFNEMLVTRKHYQNIFEINVAMHETLFKAILSRWVVYREIKNELFKYFQNFGKPFWLCMTTNDRMGASVFHFHSHISLSPFEPRIALTKARKLQRSVFAGSQNFEIGCFHGINLEMVVRSRKKFNILDLTNKKKLKEYAEELSVIRHFLLSLIKECYRYPIPLTEGMFASYLSKDQLTFLISPFFPYGALERYRGCLFFNSSSRSNAKYIRRNITNNTHLKQLMGDRIQLT